MVRYLKVLLPIVAAGLTALIAALSDDKVSAAEWLMVASAGIGTYVGAVSPTGKEGTQNNG